MYQSLQMKQLLLMAQAFGITLLLLQTPPYILKTYHTTLQYSQEELLLVVGIATQVQQYILSMMQTITLRLMQVE